MAVAAMASKWRRVPGFFARARHNVTVSPEYVFEAVAWTILSN